MHYKETILENIFFHMIKSEALGKPYLLSLVNHNFQMIINWKIVVEN